MRCVVVVSLVSVVVFAGLISRPVDAASQADDACAVLSPDDIAKTMSWKVGAGTPGKPIPGVLGKCTWTNGDNGRVIVTLAERLARRLRRGDPLAMRVKLTRGDFAASLVLGVWRGRRWGKA